MVNSRQSASGLRPNCLSFPEILSQSIATIVPTATPSVNIALVFASAGKGTWLAYLIATIGLIFVSININVFARRSAAAGSLYASIARGLGPTAGVLSGWALVLAYLSVAMVALCAFANYANVVLGVFSLHAPSILLYAICAGIAWFYAYTDMHLSAVIMLILELVSIGLILILAGIVLFGHGLTIDTSQVFLEGVSPEGIQLGLVLAVFSYVGFESATTLGDEAKNPLRFIPRAVIWSTILSGIFFILLSYTQVLGFSGYQTPLNKSDAPLSVLANLAGVDLLGVGISVGITFSMLTAALAAIIAGSRIFYAMARHGLFPSSIGRAHVKNETPHVAVTLSTLLVFIVPASISLFGISDLNIYGYIGSVGAYGFLLVYILISVAAPVYLQRKRSLRPGNIVSAVLAILFMLVPVVGSVYPVPPFPFNVFPYLFLMYLVVGGGWFLTLRQRSPQTINNMEDDMEEEHSRFMDPNVG